MTEVSYLPACRTKDLDMGMMRDCSPDHHFYQFFSSPQDFGYGGIARNRTWVMGCHKECSTCIFDPYMLLDAIIEACSVTQTQVRDYLVASESEIMMEAMDLANRRKIAFRTNSPNLEYLLLEREAETVWALNQKFRRKYGKNPEAEENLVYHLGDSSDYCSWSASSQQIPTFRVGSKSSLYWLPKYGRFLTSKEKLTAMGWPVTKELAVSQGIPLFGAKDTKRATDLVGNGMHWQTAGIFQLVSLSCFGPCDNV